MSHSPERRAAQDGEGDPFDAAVTLSAMTSVVPPPSEQGHSSFRPSLPSLADVRRSLPSIAAVRQSLTSLADVRLSRLSIAAFKPRLWAPANLLSLSMVIGGLLAFMVLFVPNVRPAVARVVQSVRAVTRTTVASPVLAHVAPKVVASGPRADASLYRENRSPISGGLLTIPPAFASEDGSYDLVIHFHGNTNLVEESFVASGLNAVVIIMNFGVGSGAYEDRLGVPGSLSEVLSRAQTVLEKRGLSHAKRRRVGLSAWSAGYGAVLKILERPAEADQVDAVLLFDGIHVGYMQNSNELVLPRLQPFERFAQQAAAGNKLFGITHSNITPAGHYAGTRETTDALLRRLGISRQDGGVAPAMPELRSMDGVMPKKKMIALEPTSIADQGGLHVRGFKGDQAEQHIMHLVQMSTTLLPELVTHWKAKASPEEL